jgi:hypothetical protein
MNLKLPLVVLLLLLSITADAATYYRKPTGTAANKAAASGPCTTVANCMNASVYESETFLDGDVIVWCDTSTGIPGKIWSLGNISINKTISIPVESYALLEGGDFILLETDDKIILQ